MTEIERKDFLKHAKKEGKTKGSKLGLKKTPKKEETVQNACDGPRQRKRETEASEALEGLTT